MTSPARLTRPFQVGQPLLLQEGHGLYAHPVFLCPVEAEGGGEKILFCPHVLGHQHVFKNGEGAEEPDVLEGAGDALPGDLVGGEADHAGVFAVVLPLIHGLHLALGVVFHDDLPRQAHPAVGGLVDTGDAVEGGGFAGAIGADEGHDLPLVDLHGQVVDGHYTAELHGDVLQAQHILSHCAHQPFRRIFWALGVRGRAAPYCP